MGHHEVDGVEAWDSEQRSCRAQHCEVAAVADGACGAEVGGVGGLLVRALPLLRPVETPAHSTTHTHRNTAASGIISHLRSKSHNVTTSASPQVTHLLCCSFPFSSLWWLHLHPGALVWLCCCAPSTETTTSTCMVCHGPPALSQLCLLQESAVSPRRCSTHHLNTLMHRCCTLTVTGASSCSNASPPQPSPTALPHSR